MIARLLPGAAALAAFGALVLVGSSLGGSYEYRQSARYLLSQQAPGKPTGERFLFDYANPDDPGAKPPAVQRVITVLPRGARYDTSAPALCEASDVEQYGDGVAQTVKTRNRCRR